MKESNVASAGIPARKGGSTGDRKPREERWAELLDVAAEVFFEKGYDATSLQEIADRTGILKGSIYYYINTKGDLLAHLLREAHETGLRNVEPIARRAGSPIERLKDMIRAHVTYVCSDRARTAVFVHERKRLTTEQRREYLGDEHAYRRLFQNVIVEAQGLDLVDDALDPKLLALCLLGSLNSLYQWYRPEGGFGLDKIADHYIAIGIDGMTGKARTGRGGASLKSKGIKPGKAVKPPVAAPASGKSRAKPDTAKARKTSSKG
jgi:AcrR family transcriptional regulator